MCEIDIQYYAEHVAEWCNDPEWIGLRTKEQLIDILESSKLNYNQFVSIFRIVPQFFDKNDVISMFEHMHIENALGTQLDFSFLEFLDDFLHIPFFSHSIISSQRKSQKL